MFEYSRQKRMFRNIYVLFLAWKFKWDFFVIFKYCDYDDALNAQFCVTTHEHDERKSMPNAMFLINSDTYWSVSRKVNHGQRQTYPHASATCWVDLGPMKTWQAYLTFSGCFVTNPKSFGSRGWKPQKVTFFRLKKYSGAGACKQEVNHIRNC